MVHNGYSVLRFASLGLIVIANLWRLDQKIHFWMQRVSSAHENTIMLEPAHDSILYAGFVTSFCVCGIVPVPVFLLMYRTVSEESHA